MNKEQRRELERKRVTLNELFQKYEFACADIAPPIKVLDGMPYSETNNVGSMTEAKAERLMDLSNAINKVCDDVVAMLCNLDAVQNEQARYMIQLRYICAYDWKSIKQKMQTYKSTENIRSTVNYYLDKVL